MRSRSLRPLQPERLEFRWLLSSDPIVSVDTNFGNFQIELRPDAAPNTVANFLQYVESGAYTDSIFHRSVPGFVEQAGGFTSSSTTFTNTSQFTTIPTNAAVNLEYDLPNVVGSVAMARTSDPNSATDQWFVNLVDNTTTLGPGGSDQYGYTVFGQVIGNGMQVIDAIAALSVDNADNGGTFSQLPLGANNELVQISSVTVDSIDGTVFSDTNGNGQLDTGEQGIAGRTVFVDLAGTGTFQSGDPTATTDASGNYSFTGVAPGTYNVYEELPGGATMPSQSVTVVANQTTSGVNFAESPSITGEVFTDLGGSGVLASGDTGVSGQTVFLNNDGTGVPDSSNPSTVTDANGNYSFSGLAAGNYTVDVQPPAGTTITTTTLTATITSGGTSQVVNIGEQPPSIVGTVFTDANDNATFDTGDIGIAGRTVFINEDGSGTADGTNPQATTNSVGQFSFSGLAAGSYTVEEMLPTGATLTTPAQTVTVTAGQTTTGVVFGELPSITGTLYVDLYNDGKHDAGDPGLAGQTVFLNIDGTGAPDANNPSTTTDSSGNFAFGTEPAGSYTVDVQLASNVTLSTPAPSITVTTGQTSSGVLLGVLPSIDGTVFTDNVGTGSYQTGDSGVAGRTVFLNNDGSGAPDNSNPSATTDSSGNYYFLGLAPGSYTVTEAAPSGITLTTSPQTVTVTAGQATSGIDLGEKGTSTGATGTATISGVVFNDLNVSGSYDTSDPGLAGRTVFLNVDGSGEPDSNNPSTTTDANGDFTFSGLAAGNYTVDELIVPFGSADPTTQPQTLALTAGQNVSGVMIGNVPTSTMVPMTVSLKAPAAATDPNTAYIDALYQSILNHAPDANGLAYWQQQMAAGASQAAVAQGIWDSAEHRGDEVEQFYEEFLGRPSDPAGKAFWVNAFTTWGNEQLEVIGFLTSTPEFQNLHSGSTNFVDAVYENVDARPADSAGESYWVNQLAGGETPVQMAYSFVFGQEADTALVDAYYSDFLHRAPDSASLQMYVNDLTSQSMTADEIAIQLLSSSEFFNRVTNQAPAITSAADTTFTVGTAGSFTIDTTGEPTASITETGSLPSGVTFTDNSDGTATLAGTPAAGNAGSYPLTITASNGVSPDATQSFTLTITGPAIASIANTTFKAGTAGSISVQTSGFPTTPSITASGLPADGDVKLTDNGNGTATIAGTAITTDAGTYDVTITATDPGGDTATQSFTLTISGPAIASIANTTFNAGTAGSISVQTSGFPTTPTITASGLPADGDVKLTDNGNGTATIAGTPVTTDAGTYDVTVTATDAGGDTATQSFTLSIAGPSITSIPNTTFSAGTAGSISVQTSGFPTTPTITASGLPADGVVTLTDNGNGTATIAGTPTVADAGTYDVTVTATDANDDTATQSFTLTIAGPAIASIANTTFSSGTAGSISVQTSGFAATPTITASGLPGDGDVTLTDNGNGTATIAGTPTAADTGTYNVTVTATDASDDTANQSFTLTIAAPAVASIADTTFTAGTAGNINVQTSGFPTTPSIKASGLPSSGDVTLNDNGDGTATIAGTPTAADAGSYNVMVTATDTNGDTANQSFTLTIAAPAVASIPDTTFTAGTAGSINVQTSGFPTAPSIKASGLPSSGDITLTDNGDGTATIAGTPTASDAGTYAVTVTATDTNGDTANQSFTLTVS